MNKAMCQHFGTQTKVIIGASLSEPHTSVTALHMHVYVYLWTDHLPEILNKRV